MHRRRRYPTARARRPRSRASSSARAARPIRPGVERHRSARRGDAENLRAASGPSRRIRPLQPQADGALAEHEPARDGVERRQPGRKHRVGRHHARSDRAPCRTFRRRHRRRRRSAPTRRLPAADPRLSTIAARPDASLWLTVMFGPRRRCSSPTMLAAEFATVLSNSSAGAAAGPWRNSASRNFCVDPPPAVQVPSIDAAAIVAVGGNRRCRRHRAPASSPPPRTRRCDPCAASSSARPTATASKPSIAAASASPAVGGVEACSGRDGATAR